MTKRQALLLFLLLVAVAAFILLFSWNKSSGPQMDWQEYYGTENPQPYGTKVLKELLKDQVGSGQFIELEDSLFKVLPDSGIDQTYVFVGEGMLIDEVSIEHLLTFTHEGNYTFLISRVLPYDLLDGITNNSCEDWLYQDYEVVTDTLAAVRVFEPAVQADTSYTLRFMTEKGAIFYDWDYVPDEFFCEGRQAGKTLGYIKSYYPNFVKFPFGAGALYLHTTPLAFSNYHLREEAGLRYLEQVFSHSPLKTLYWDSFHQINAAIARQINESDFAQSRKSFNQDGPLRYILSQPSLAWAWYLGLLFAGTYIAFRAKRKQRIIPVLARNENTSLEFIQAISQLALNHQDHRKMALQLMRSWLWMIREKYRMSTSTLDQAFCEALALRSNTQVAQVAEIIRQYREIKKSSSISTEQLTNFYEQLEPYYQTLHQRP